MYRGLLGEEKVGSVKRKIAVDFIGGNLMITLDAVLAAGVHHSGGAHDIGLQEHAGILDGAVHVGLGGKVHHRVRLLMLEDLIDRSPVADVHLVEFEVGVLQSLLQRGEIACVGQRIQTDDPILGVVFQFKVDEVCADEAGAAGQKYGHFHLSPFQIHADPVTCLSMKARKTTF